MTNAVDKLIEDETLGNQGRQAWNGTPHDPAEAQAMLGGAIRTIDRLLTSLRQAHANAHRCAGCGLRWSGAPTVAELCGDCWRTAQPTVHAPKDDPAITFNRAQARLRAIRDAHRWQLTHMAANTPTPDATYLVVRDLLSVVLDCGAGSDPVGDLAKALALTDDDYIVQVPRI